MTNTCRRWHPLDGHDEIMTTSREQFPCKGGVTDTIYSRHTATMTPQFQQQSGAFFARGFRGDGSSAFADYGVTRQVQGIWFKVQS